MSAMILTNNPTPTAVGAGGIIPLGSAIHGFGKGINLTGNAIGLRDTGYFFITANVTASVTGTTAMDLNLLVDGDVVETSSATPATAGDIVNITLIWIVRKSCCCDARRIQFSSSVAATIQNMTVEVVEG